MPSIFFNILYSIYWRRHIRCLFLLSVLKFIIIIFLIINCIISYVLRYNKFETMNTTLTLRSRWSLRKNTSTLFCTWAGDQLQWRKNTKSVVIIRIGKTFLFSTCNATTNNNYSTFYCSISDFIIINTTAVWRLIQIKMVKRHIIIYLIIVIITQSS